MMLNFRVSAVLLERLKMAAVAAGLSVSGWIREAVLEKLAREGDM